LSDAEKDKLGYWEVTAIGVGGMVGSGIFAVLGLSVDLNGGGAPMAFLIAGIVAFVTSYSYARLSVTFPSQGGDGGVPGPRVRLWCADGKHEYPALD